MDSRDLQVKDVTTICSPVCRRRPGTCILHSVVIIRDCSSINFSPSVLAFCDWEGRLQANNEGIIELKTIKRVFDGSMAAHLQAYIPYRSLNVLG